MWLICLFDSEAAKVSSFACFVVRECAASKCANGLGRHFVGRHDPQTYKYMHVLMLIQYYTGFVSSPFCVVNLKSNLNS
jgi:hypothetical protein